MKKDLSDLLDMTYELEGLIHLCKERSEIPEQLSNLLKAKVEHLTELVSELPESEENTPETFQEYIEDTVEDPYVETEAAPEPAAEEFAPTQFSVDENEAIADSTIFEEEEDADEPVDFDYIIAPDEKTTRFTDLRKLISINDRFRFRRELFGNSDSALTSALQNIATLNSITEAEDFVYNDLKMDAENPEVMAFMSIIETYFH